MRRRIPSSSRSQGQEAPTPGRLYRNLYRHVLPGPMPMTPLCPLPCQEIGPESACQGFSEIQPGNQFDPHSAPRIYFLLERQEVEYEC